MKWLPVIVLTVLVALWCLQRLLASTARREEAWQEVYREKVSEAIGRKAL